MTKPPINLDILASPDDGSSLRLQGDQLVSAKDANTYPIRDGILYLLSPSLVNEKTKQQEKEGWEKVFKEHNWQPSGQDILSLPESSDDPYWRKVTVALEYAFAAMQYHKAQCGLDLACGIGWATVKFSQRGIRMIAADFNDTEFNGLAAANKTREHGVDFDAVCCDGEQLPVADNALDFVFICSALHHFTRPDIALKEINRILKPGGVLIDICESFRTGWKDEEREAEHAQLVEFREAGINENSYTQKEYERLFAGAGFSLLTLVPEMDSPDPTSHPGSWRNTNLDEFVKNRRRPIVRAALSLGRRTPILALYRWAKLTFAITERVFLAYK